MKKSNIRIGLASMLVLGLATGYASAQGSLTPPGAPAPTMKTLDQVEPRIDLATVDGTVDYHHKIQQPGSYYLSENLVATKTSGIYINVTGVTLDLNGFEISRASGSSGSGVRIDSAGEGATVRNGSISGFSHGIYSIPLAEGCLFEKLSVSACAIYGIYSTASSSQIIDCRVFNNSGIGIYASGSSTLSGCTANNNEGYGIYANGNSTLSGCTANNNEDYGIRVGEGSTLSGCIACSNQGDGIYVLNGGSSLSGCTANDNQGIGINIGLGSTLSGCTANNNQGDGIHVLGGSSLSDCTAFNNRSNHGIYVGAGSTLRGCTANNNAGTGSSSYGIYVIRSTVIGCSAYLNINTNSPGTSSQGVGIYAGNGSTIKDCAVSRNEGDGILIFGDCAVYGNTCDGNGYYDGDGAGIHSYSTDNRIDGNNVTDNDRGIDVDTYGSLIVRNSASGNTTDYDIAASNDVGTIQTTPVDAGAWDNFEF